MLIYATGMGCASNVALARADFDLVNACSTSSVRSSIKEDKNSISCCISHIRLREGNPISNFFMEITMDTFKFKPFDLLKDILLTCVGIKDIK